MVGRSSGEGGTRTSAHGNYMLKIEDLKKLFTRGGLLTLILSILIAIFLWLLNPLSFICTDQDVCNRPGTIRLPPQP